MGRAILWRGDGEPKRHMRDHPSLQRLETDRGMGRKAIQTHTRSLTDINITMLKTQKTVRAP